MSTAFAPQLVAPSASALGAEDTRLFRRARTWWTIAVLFSITQGGGLFTEQGKFQYKMQAIRELTNAPSHTLLPVTLATVAICLGLIVTHLRPVLRLMLQQKAMLAFAILAFVSTLWSQVPLLTVRRAALLSVAIFLGWFLATYYSPPDQMRILLAVGVVVALASLAMALFLPQYGISWGGDWKGVFRQKNHMGIGIFFLFAGLPFCRLASRRQVLSLALQAILPLGLIFLSGSRTSWFLVLLLIAVRVLGPLITRTRREKLPFLLYGLAFSVAATVLSLGVVLSFLGRDLTFSGRTREWGIIIPFAFKHFWLGYGFQAFWVGAIGDSGTVQHLIGGQNVSDNGYVDAALQFGFLGVVMFVILLLTGVRDFGKLLRRPAIPLAAYWYAGLIVATLAGSFSETIIWTSGRIEVVMFALGFAGLRTLNWGQNTPPNAYTDIRPLPPPLPR